MVLFEFFCVAHQLLEVFRQRASLLAHHLPQSAQILASLSFIDLLAPLALPEIAQRQRDVCRRLLGPIGEKVSNVAERRLVELVECPPGSGDDFARNPWPIDPLATGCYSPSATGAIPEAPCIALLISGSVFMSSQPVSCSSVTSE